MTGASGWRATWQRIPGQARLLIGVNVFNSLGSGAVLPFVWIYLVHTRGLATWVPATSLSVAGAVAIFAGTLWGAQLDRGGPRSTVVAAMVCAGVGTALYGFATTPAVGIAAGLVYGIGISGVGVSLRSLLALAAPPELRRLVYGVDYAVFNGSVALGVLVGGAVVSSGIGTPGQRYEALFLLDGITFVLAALVLGRGLKVARPDDKTSERGQYRNVLRNRVIMLAVGAMLLTALVTYGQFKAALPAYLTGPGDLSAGTLSIAYAVNLIVIVVVQLLVMPRLEGAAKRALLTVGGGCFAISWFGVLIAGRSHGAFAVALAVGSVGLFGIGEVLVAPTIVAWINDTVSARERGRANALLSMSVSTGTVLGPALTGLLLGWHSGVVLMVVLIALSCGVILAASRMREPLRSAQATGMAGDGLAAEQP